MQWELVEGIWIWCRAFEGASGEFVEINIGSLGRKVPAVEPGAGLTDMGGAANVVDGEAGGGKAEGQVEELVQVTLSRQRHHHDADLGLGGESFYGRWRHLAHGLNVNWRYCCLKSFRDCRVLVSLPASSPVGKGEC